MAEHAHGHHGHGGDMTPEQQKQMIEQEIKLSRNLGQIKHKIAVMSGKGGVGKSTVAANLAETLQKLGFKTGILDADIHGPNIPKMLGLEGEELFINEDHAMIPVVAPSGLKVMSMAFMLDSIDTPIIWRGPQKTGSIKQLIADVAWGPLDFLIIDNPPGNLIYHKKLFLQNQCFFLYRISCLFRYLFLPGSIRPRRGPMING